MDYMLQGFRTRFRRIMRKILSTGDPPERVARGIAAGFLASAFPLAGCQIPLSLLFAWLVRGNKAVSIIPQFLSNAVTMLPLAFLQYRLGAALWPSRAAHADQAMAALKSAGEAWVWSSPVDSLVAAGAALASVGADVLGPLTLGVILSGMAAAIISYPISLVSLSIYYSYRLRKRMEQGMRPQQPVGEFPIPPSGAAEPADSATAVEYGLHAAAYVRADTAKLLVDGRQAYPEMLAAIAAAEHSVDLETYILRADRTGRRFAAALSAAAARGVRVRLLYDGFGSLGLPHDYTDALLQAGVHVAAYRPLSTFWRRGLGRMNRRDHRKILVVDVKTAFTGGLNIGDEYAAREDGGEGWRDTHVRLDGAEPARQLQEPLEATWDRADRLHLSPHAAATPAPVVVAPAREGQAGEAPAAPATSSNVPVQVLSNREFIRRVRVRQAYLHAIKRAKRYILIENAYFIPDRRIRRALRVAVRRGVAVGVVVAMHSDLKIVAMASRALYGELLASGVRLYEYPVSMLHCKAAVIDDVWSVVTSYNLDHRSLLHNLEVGVLMLDRKLAQALRNQIVADIGRCREVTMELHKARSWNQALLESLAYQIRYWL